MTTINAGRHIRNMTAVALVCLMTSACADRATSLPDEPKNTRAGIVNDDDQVLFTLNLDDPSGRKVSIGRVSDLSPAQRAARESLRNNPDHQKRMERLHELTKREAPPLAVLEKNLPEGAAAQIIVDPTSDQPRLIVVSAHTFNDRILELSRHHLHTFELTAPDQHGRAVMTLWPDETLRLEFQNKTRQFKPDVKMFNFQDRGYAQKILARARKQPLGNLKGLGKARIVQLKGRRGQEP
jgi:hypothetical protein